MSSCDTTVWKGISVTSSTQVLMYSSQSILFIVMSSVVLVSSGCFTTESLEFVIFFLITRRDLFVKIQNLVNRSQCGILQTHLPLCLFCLLSISIPILFFLIRILYSPSFSIYKKMMLVFLPIIIYHRVNFTL